YMFVLVLPTLYYTLQYFLPTRRGVNIVTGIVGLLLVMPYRWLGLHAYYGTTSETPYGQPWTSPDLPLPQADWFPRALRNLPAIPHEGLLFLGLLLLGAGTSAWMWRRAGESGASPGKHLLLAFLGIYSLILLQTWLHLSLRSPYTYLCHYEKKVEANYWYHHYLFADGKGAVNTDYIV